MSNFEIIFTKIDNRMPLDIFNLNRISFKRLFSDWLVTEAFYNIGLSEFFNSDIPIPILAFNFFNFN